MGDKLSATDNLFFQLETDATPMHVGGLLVFSGDSRGVGARYERWRRTAPRAAPFNFRMRAPAAPGLKPSWDTLADFDLAAHVQQCSAPRPGRDEQLMAHISDMHGTHVPRDRPLWECHLIDGLDGSDRFACYYKIHHACIDGMSAIRRMQDALSTDPAERTPALWAYEPPTRARSDRGRRSVGRRLQRAAVGIRDSARVAAEIAGALRESTRRPDAVVPFTAPQTPLNRVTVSGERNVAWQRLPLSEVRAVGKSAGATVNEVMVGVVAGVLRNYLLSIDALPERPLVAMLPVSLRAADDDVAGTLASILLCNLATHIADPAERLAAIVASSAEGKRMIRGMSKAAAAQYVIAAMFPAIAAMRLGVYQRFPLPFNVVISNVAGPRQPLYDDGARLEAIYPISMLFDRQSINFTMISYLDELDIGLVATREGIADLPGMARDLRTELDALAEAVR